MTLLQYARRSIARFTSSCSFSTIACAQLDPNHSIYISKSSNPYFNLSVEDWLFRHKHHKEPLLFLYRDRPCVVIGRNQNPWKEVNLPASHSTGIPFIRRRSGGGTVYHDLGNTNFSIHLSRTAFDRHATAQVVLRAVRSLGIDANVNDRNDICVGKEKICSSKAFVYVSGSAYKIVNNRAYHHGTMLISTRLDTLGNLLRTSKATMETKGVASVRSPVCNLQQFDSSVNHEKFVNAVVSTFRDEYDIHEDVHEIEETEETISIPYIRDSMAELPRWDWAFGQTPEFTYTIQESFAWGEVTAKVHSKHGIILDCSFEYSGTDSDTVDLLRELGSSLEGQKYAFVQEKDLDAVGDAVASGGVLGDVWQWLKIEMSH
ncbi:Lipoyltransferase and lipoate-protein ligase [Trametopsis cervina]|nr:Lipoyltransferase and lipoate-protein ligase [Trametopsis cervina]